MPTSTRRDTTAGSDLAVADLLADLDELIRRAVQRLVAGDTLDAYLLAAGAVQIVEDHLQRDQLAMRRAAVYLRGRGLPAVLSSVLIAIAHSLALLRALRPAVRRAARWRDDCASLMDGLAGKLMAPPEQAASEVAAGARDAALASLLHDEMPTLQPDLAADVLRIPSGFRSFDLHPEDMTALATRYAETHGAPDQPLLVLGLRTSGSYLAPLLGAALRARGHTDVRNESTRPGQPLRIPVRSAVRAVARAGGRVLVVDDPPVTGRSVQKVTRQLFDAGVPDDAVSLLLPVLGDELPTALHHRDAVVLPFDEWSIHQRLTADAVGAALSRLLGQPVLHVRRRASSEDRPRRGHIRALFDVELSDRDRRTVVVTGAGVGYFGRHALAVARALPDYVPRTYGFVDGVVLRDWLPADHQLRELHPDDLLPLAEYVQARAAALPATTDHSVGLSGQEPVWEVASRVFQRGYGRLGVLLRLLVLEPLVRALCAVQRPSVVDGATAFTHWFREQRGLRKVNVDVRDFANTDLTCYDPVYDLAGIDPGSRDLAVGATLREAMPCDAERFLIYELVHLWDRERSGQAAHRASARAVQHYVSQLLLGGLNASPDGRLCALDLDGVLESDALGFPIMTPTAALALRSLIAHGYRPVLVTGRSLDEVEERCESYGLTGGVAEYGSVVYHHATRTVHDRISAEDRRTLADVRAALRRTPDVVVDEDYGNSVRAYRVGPDGGRRALPRAVVDKLLDELGVTERVRVIRGIAQTDLVAAGVDKGRGLRTLARLLGVPADPDGIALAVGDSAADLPALGMARRAFAPSNADAEVRAAGIRVVRRAYGSGFAQAAKQFLGHGPGGCATCRPPAPGPRSRALLTLLDAQRAAVRGLPFAVVRGLVRNVRGAV